MQTVYTVNNITEWRNNITEKISLQVLDLLIVSIESRFDENNAQVLQALGYLHPCRLEDPIVREAEVQKYMSTYHIEGQFHFALKLSVTCLM